MHRAWKRILEATDQGEKRREQHRGAEDHVCPLCDTKFVQREVLGMVSAHEMDEQAAAPHQIIRHEKERLETGDQSQKHVGIQREHTRHHQCRGDELSCNIKVKLEHLRVGADDAAVSKHAAIDTTGAGQEKCHPINS